jgi:hypothetical protein
MVAAYQRYQGQVADLTKRLADVQKPRLTVDNAARADQAFDNAQKAVAEVTAQTTDIVARWKGGIGMHATATADNERKMECALSHLDQFSGDGAQAARITASADFQPQRIGERLLSV